MSETGPKIEDYGPADPITVIASDARWVVVEKPCGMSIHNDPGGDLCAAVLAMARAGCLSNVDRGIHTLHAVHRIDKETSGIVLLACDPETLAFFGRQFAEKAVGKRYLALVHGHFMGVDGKGAWIDWTWPLTASAAGRNDPMGRGNRIPCTTRARLVSHSSHYSLIECEPLTGRKHQIRRHAKLAGHPVVGDRRYGSRRSLAYLYRHHEFERLALHAHILSIRLPCEENSTTFQSNGMPEQLRQLFESDR